MVQSPPPRAWIIRLLTGFPLSPLVCLVSTKQQITALHCSKHLSISLRVNPESSQWMSCKALHDWVPIPFGHHLFPLSLLTSAVTTRPRAVSDTCQARSHRRAVALAFPCSELLYVLPPGCTWPAPFSPSSLCSHVTCCAFQSFHSTDNFLTFCIIFLRILYLLFIVSHPFLVGCEPRHGRCSLMYPLVRGTART